MMRHNIRTNLPFLAAILLVCIAAESIGTISFKIASITVSIFPMLLSMFMIFALYMAKPITFVSENQYPFARKFVIYGIAIYIASTGTSIGHNIMSVLHASPALFLQEFGNLGTTLLAFPIALLLGFKREAIGMTFSIARDQGVAIIGSQYGMDSAEGRGVMMVYIIGTFIGTLCMGILFSVLASLDIFHPYALAMSCGVGSGSMMAAGTQALIEAFPAIKDDILAFASTSNTLSGLDLTYISVLITLPVLEIFYKVLVPLSDWANKRK